ncbi:DUF177 domain-containing protein [Candidatus Sumerlaeota bacterium]|nr:DUF177 domain-containing protein [Candidatus Sumerlaeota bacterium]
MKVKVHLIGDLQPLELQQTLPPKELGLEEALAGDTHLAQPVEFIAPIEVDLRLKKIGQRIRVTGRMSAKVRLECVRTLEPFEQELNVENIELMYIPAPPRTEDEETGERVVTVALEDEDFAYYIHDELTLDNELRELLLLEVPAFPHKYDESPFTESLPPACGDEEAESDKNPDWQEQLNQIHLPDDEE